LQALNGSYSDSDRADIASQLVQMRDQLVQLSNTTDANGQALFAGTSATTTPFVKNADGTVTYAGNSGQLKSSIGAGLQIPVSDSGTALFMTVPAGNGTYVASAAAGNTGTLIVGVSALISPSDSIFVLKELAELPDLIRSSDQSRTVRLASTQRSQQTFTHRAERG